MSAAKRITVGIAATLILAGCGSSEPAPKITDVPSKSSVAADATEPLFSSSTYTQETNRAVVDDPSTSPVQDQTGSAGRVAEADRTVAAELSGNGRTVVAGSEGGQATAGDRTSKDTPVAPVVEGRARAVNPNPPIATPTDPPAVVSPAPEVTLIPPVVYPCPEEDPESCAPSPEPVPAPTVTRVERDVNPTPTFEEATLP